MNWTHHITNQYLVRYVTKEGILRTIAVTGQSVDQVSESVYRRYWDAYKILVINKN